MIEFKMPSLGADMASGRLVRWQVGLGDKVKRGDIIAEVETHKGNIEVEVWDSGVVHELIVEPGTEVPVGTVLALLEPLDGETNAPIDQRQTAATHPEHRIGPPHKQRYRISPLARKLARSQGVDLSLLSGTGPNGAISRCDVEDHIARSRKGASHLGGDKTRLQMKTRAMRQAIAAAMSRSKRDIPHYYLQTDVNMQSCLSWLEELNNQRSVQNRILPVALYLKALALAIADVPEMNGFWVDGAFHPSKSVHIGMGISLRHGGLVAPAIHDVDQKTIPEIMSNMLDLVARARSGKLKSSEISDATITVTSLGDQGVETVFGVIYPPQVALVGFGRMTSKPWAMGQYLGVAPVTSVTLSADHRASDGHRGGIFLNHLREYLAKPQAFEL